MVYICRKVAFEDADMCVTVSKMVFDPRMQMLRDRVYAAGMGGIVRQMLHGTFAIIAAWRNNLNDAPNYPKSSKRDDDDALRELIKNLGYGFVRFHGVYFYVGPEEGQRGISDYAFFVPGIPMEEAQQLADVCSQESFVWADKGRWGLYSAKDGQTVDGLDNLLVADSISIIQPTNYEDPEVTCASDTNDHEEMDEKERRKGRTPPANRKWVLDARKGNTVSHFSQVQEECWFFSFSLRWAPFPVLMDLYGFVAEADVKFSPGVCEALLRVGG